MIRTSQPLAFAFALAVTGTARAQSGQQPPYPNQYQQPQYPNQYQQPQYPNQYSNAPPPSSGGSYNPGAPPNNYSAAQTYDAEQGKSSSADSGRGLEFFYANAGVGLSVLGLQTFSSNKLSLERTSSAGPAFDVGAGVRLLILTIGPRFRYHQLSSFNFWQLAAEVGLHIPAGKLDPYLTLSGGYAAVGSFDQDAIPTSASGVKSSDVKVNGGTLGLAFGMDYYASKNFSVGGELGGQLLFLSRQEVASTTSPFGSASASVGANGLFQAHVGLHL